MGDEAEDIVTSLRMTEAAASMYNTVKEKLEGHFVVRRNVIFERAKFNQKQQEQGETVLSLNSTACQSTAAMDSYMMIWSVTDLL